VSYFTGAKLRGPLQFAAGFGVLAVVAGWASYSNNPTGLLQYADGNVCPSIVHSFSTIYWAVIAIAAISALVVGIVCAIVSDLGLFAHIRPNLRALASSCAWAVGALLLLALPAFPLKSIMPLTPSEPCKSQSSALTRNPILDLQ
jgi:hypothetical protein